jgi:hypothetical protein
VVKAATRAGRTGVAADFHRLRIRCKRLRYSLEFTAGVYGGRTEPFTKKLAKLQDSLGLMQDAEVATARLLELATASPPDGGGGLPPRTVFAMGAVAERYRAESAQLLAGMTDRLALLHGKEWRNMAGHMDRRREETLAALPPPPAPRPVAAADDGGDAAPGGHGAPTAGPGDLPSTGPRRNGDGARVADAPGPDCPGNDTPEPAAGRWPPPLAGPDGRTPELAPPATVAAALMAWPDAVWGPPQEGSGEG